MNHRHEHARSWTRLWYGSLLVGTTSLLWFLIRTGGKPSRAAYPCQKAALANASAWLGTLALPAVAQGAVGLKPRDALPAGSSPLRIVVLFLAAAAVAGIAGQAAGLLAGASAQPAGQAVGLKLAESRLSAGTFSDIYAVQGTTGADGGFRRLLEQMEDGGQSFYALFHRNDLVILKVNSQWDERGGTNTDLVRAIVEGLLAHPDGFAGEIVIADNGQSQYGSEGFRGILGSPQLQPRGGVLPG